LHDFDALYESGQAFADVYAHIVEAVIGAARQGDIVYAVPGHPLVGEATVHEVLRRARALNIPTRIISGLSFIEPVLEALAQARTGAREQQSPPLPRSPDALDGLQICDALELATLHHPAINPDKPALIGQVYSRAIASDVKLTLMNQYPPEHVVWIVRGGAWEQGGTGAAVSPAPRLLCSPSPLRTLDHHDDFDHLTSLYVPAMPFISGFEAFQETVAYLRAPNGCPWDREQTHESLRSALLEEVYEVLAALDEGDLVALREELGDVLLNVVMQVQIATEAEEFRMVDVIGEIDAKLKRRHPHVFGDITVSGVGEVLTNWSAIKQQEYKDQGKPARESAIDGIPPALPALAQAQKMAHKAERAGFRFDNHEQRLAKSHEELDELLTAHDDTHRKEELGDLLFTIADLADGYGIEAETALREANLKFARRFRAMEAIVRERQLDMKAMTPAELQAVWQEVKGSERVSD
jgi:tetrapyrrole methylase family protein/MazG family protein